ncbi:MAG: PPC domain-containing protein [Gemmataceae bacterium]
MRKISFLIVFILAISLMNPLGAIAQKGATFPANAAAPTLKAIAIPGAKRGTTATINLTGTNLANPLKVITSIPGKVSIPPENNNGKDATKVQVKIEIPTDAQIGFHSIRVGTAKGISNVRIFCVDDLPEITKVDTCKNKNTPQPITMPCVVSGKIDNESSDFYKISAKAGQRITMEVIGRRLGSAMDPQLTLYDAKTFRELPKGYSNDSPGLQTDPRLVHTFVADGEYLIEVRDVSYRGGDDYIYRLRVGDFPMATSPLPMALKRGSKQTIRFAGPHATEAQEQEVTAPTDPTIDTIWITPKGKNGQPGWPVCLLVTDMEEKFEQEPNNEPAKASKLTIPAALTARLLEKGDADYYSFAAKKDQRIIIESTTLDLFSPTEVYMVLKDAKGAKLMESNPTQAPRLDFKAPADGEYTLFVEHLHLWGGPTEAYRLTLTDYQPGFDLSIGGTQADVAIGGKLSLPILVTRRDYADPIEVTVEGPKGFKGKLTIPKGQPAQAGQSGGNLDIEVDENTPIGPETIRIVGTATINKKPYKTFASVKGALSTALAGLPYPPRTMWREFGIGVQPQPAFALSLKFDPATIKPGEKTTLTVTAKRAKGFEGEIALTVNGLPAMVTTKATPIPKDANEVKLEISTTDKAAAATPAITVTGKAKVNDKDESSTSGAATLTIKK